MLIFAEKATRSFQSSYHLFIYYTILDDAQSSWTFLNCTERVL